MTCFGSQERSHWHSCSCLLGPAGLLWFPVVSPWYTGFLGFQDPISTPNVSILSTLVRRWVSPPIVRVGCKVWNQSLVALKWVVQTLAPSGLGPEPPSHSETGAPKAEPSARPAAGGVLKGQTLSRSKDQTSDSTERLQTCESTLCSV